MTSGADTFPVRSGALRPMLNDDESSAMLSSLSATTTCDGSMNAARTFLDDLLQEDVDGHQQTQTQSYQLLQSHEDVVESSAMTDAGALGDGVFFSLEDEHITTYSSPSSSGSPSTLSGALSSSRLLQLETNYEMKKKRAKICRKDLNSRFQELMDLLHLKEDRKLNRAKILEKAIEHIEKLTAELNALKTRNQPQQQGENQKHQVGLRKTASLLHHPHQLYGVTSAMMHSMGQHEMTSAKAHSMGQHNFVGSARGSTTLLPYNPSQGHLWRNARFPLAPMMWTPCPEITSSRTLLKRDAIPARPADTSSRKRGRLESTTTTASEIVSTSSLAEPTAVTVTCSSITNGSSMFERSAQIVPTLLSYCDAWTLVSVMRTSRKLMRAAHSEKLWGDLCRSRWRMSLQMNIPHPFEQWQRWHDTNRMPDCADFTRDGQLFASGRAKGISVWGLISHRSNGHITRTVSWNGNVTVMQVVELLVVVQNLSHARVHVTDNITLVPKASVSESGDANSFFKPFTASSGAHLTPTMVAVNYEACVTKDLGEVALLHGDLCVLRVFLSCPGLNLEDTLLQRPGYLNMQCTIDSQDETRKCVNVRALCKDYNESDRT